MSELSDLAARVAELNKKSDATDDLLRTGMARRNTGAQWVNPGSGPNVRAGENVMGSRGLSFAKALGAMGTNAMLPRSQAQHEFNIAERLAKANPGFIGDRPTSILMPIWEDGFSEGGVDESFRHEIKSMLRAGVEGYDPDEANWLARKHMGQKSAVTPSIGWVDQTALGSFVGPATFGAPIDLLRNREVLMNAGATVVPLGPSGKLTMPRLTAATQGGWSAESVQQTPVNPRSGNLTLSAKKAIGVVVFSGELLRFGGPAVEGIVRNDLMKTVALIADKGFLEGPGSDQQPLGLATMLAAAGNPYGLAIVTPSAANQLAPQDFQSFLSGVEENNADATKGVFVMRPSMYYAAVKARWTPYSGGTSQGGFVMDMMRSIGDSFANNKVIAGARTVTSPQISNTRGTGAQTYVLFLGEPDDIYIGMFGAIEFTQTDQGWTLFSSDQVAVRALMHCDVGARHPGIIAGCDNLNVVVAG